MKDRIEELEYRLEKQKETSACRNSQIATLQKRVKELEAENDHTAFDALAEKYELAKDKIKTLEEILKRVEDTIIQYGVIGMEEFAKIHRNES